MSNQVFRNRTKKYGRLVTIETLTWLLGATGTNRVLLERSRVDNTIRLTINEFSGVSITSGIRRLSAVSADFRPQNTQYFPCMINLNGVVTISWGAIEPSGEIFITGAWTNPNTDLNYTVVAEYNLD